MLVLSRKVGEVLCIGDDITIEVTGIVGGQVRFAIDAPRNVSIDRKEIRDRKDAERSQDDHEQD